ncbi:phytanoyl-CoA dioxygenase [uncultured Kordia sp.]|uniref:phytanoyl-CoA dioxygenase n=1 Tax=uncultured Kordia sp. TaxID=507699 RepID=UPI002603024B|nr:phytanoyl-CoA dioxygenase [uncultured Kordia sp.]
MLRNTIKELSTTILNNQSDFDTIKNTIDEIHTHYLETTNIRDLGDGMQHMAAVPTASGMALSLNHAAACLLDYRRTAKFLDGMVTLIREKQQQHPNETINIFYAGCGPYAPFITLVAPLFKASEVQFSILEINASSIKMAEELINALELTEYVTAYHNADAVTFQIPDAKKYHILFSETLDALLYRESYVPILWNMLPQISDNCAVIPNNVIVQASLTYPQKEGEDTRKEKEAAVILDVREAVKVNDGTKSLPQSFEPITINLSGDEKYHTMIVDTKVHIHNDIWLHRNESSLSIPLEMEIVYPLEAPNVTFFYELKPSVELKLQN